MNCRNRGILLCFIIALSSLSCRQNFQEKEFKAFIGTEFDLLIDSLIGFNISNKQLGDLRDSKYKLITYIDSQMICTSCWMRIVSYIEDMISDEIEGINRVYIFNYDDVSNIQIELDVIGLKIPYFLDPGALIKKQNRNFPTIEALKTFMLKDNKVILVGSPVSNPKMTELYLSIHDKE